MKTFRDLPLRFRPSLLLALMVLGTAVVPRPVRAADEYVLTDLGSLPGGTAAYANAVNDSGQVVGSVATASTTYPVLFSGTGSNNLNLGLSNGSAAEALDINDVGQIVGYTIVTYHRATLFSGTGSNNTVFNTTNGYLSLANSINGSGVFVGVSDDYSNNVAHATSFTAASTYTNLDGPNGPQSEAYAINASGTIVGSVSIPGVTGHAAVFTGSGYTDLGTLGTSDTNNSYAYGINDTGTIVGGATLTPGGGFHAVIYSGTGTNNTDLGTLGGLNAYAYGVNNSGLIVGNAQFDTTATFHAFIYKNGVMTDLNTIVLNQASAGLTDIRINTGVGPSSGHCVNASGQIAATATGKGGTHAVLLTPLASFFSGETALANGVYYLAFPAGNYFGYYSYLTNPRYIYHFDLGFEYWFDAADGKSGVYLYDFASQSFFYTSPSFPFPYLYDFTLKTVLYYYPDTKNAGHYTTNPRYFYNFATGKIITK